jgi:hypothetical protein
MNDFLSKDETSVHETSLYELTPAELDQVAGGIRDINVGIGNIDLSSGGTNNSLNFAFGRARDVFNVFV